jgi:Cu/Ag efflux protein CusF
LKVSKIIILVNVALALGFLAGYLWQQQELERLRREGVRTRPAAELGADRIATARGFIRGLRRDQSTILITHEALDGIMESMTMAYRATDPSVLDAIAPGDRVQFTVRSQRGELLILALQKQAS